MPRYYDPENGRLYDEAGNDLGEIARSELKGDEIIGVPKAFSEMRDFMNTEYFQELSRRAGAQANADAAGGAFGNLKQNFTSFKDTALPAMILAQLAAGYGAGAFAGEAAPTAATVSEAAPVVASGGPVGAGGMPAAVPAPDPTFGGALQQTAPGVFSAPGASGYVGAAGSVAAAGGGGAGGGAAEGSTAAGDVGAGAEAPASDVPSSGPLMPPATLPGPADGLPTPVGSPGLPADVVVPPTSSVSSPQISSFPMGGGGDAGFGPPVADPTVGGPDDPLRKAVDAASGADKTSSATGSGVLKALEKLGIYGPNGIGANALPLGGLVASQALNARSRNNLTNQLKDAGALAKGTSERLLGQGAGGEVPPAIMTQFKRTYDTKVGEITQRYANMGRDAATDSGAQTEIQRAADARDAQIAQYAQQLTSQGLQAAQIASGPTTNAALAAAQQDKDLAASMGNTLSTLAMLEAMRGRVPA